MNWRVSILAIWLLLLGGCGDGCGCKCEGASGQTLKPQVLTDHVELIEVNTVYRGTEGVVAYRQVIFWAHHNEYGRSGKLSPRLRVAAWRIFKQPTTTGERNGQAFVAWNESGVSRIVTANSMITTVSGLADDPERLDGHEWPINQRRGLFGIDERGEG